MKRFFLVLLALILVCGLLASCGTSSGKAPLQVCIDAGPYSGGNTAAIAENFFLNARDLGGAEDVEATVVPAEGADRKSTLTRLRTEIAAGQGPDVFILYAYDGHAELEDQFLFRFPEQVMARNTFLKLDDYIAGAQYMEWDKLDPAIMAAGRNEDGQFLLPLAYTFPAAVYQDAELTAAPDKTTTWQDMAGSQDPLLQNTAVLSNMWTGNQVTEVFGRIADYQTEELLFTQEEMERVFQENLELEESLPSLDGEYFCAGMGLNFNEVYGEKVFWDNVEIVPLCCLDGGATAVVTAYCGVNANTKRPEEAFRLLDILMEKGSQQNSDLYNILLNKSMPVYQGLGQESDPIQGWSMSGQNYQAFLEAKEAVSTVKFCTPLDEHLRMGNALYSSAVRQGGDPSKAAEDAYREMKMEIAES